MNKAVDEARKREHREYRARGDETLARLRYQQKPHNVLTYFIHRITNAVAEGLNSKIQAVEKAASGFRSFENFKTAIFFHCGGLRLYPVTHGNPG